MAFRMLAALTLLILSFIAIHIHLPSPTSLSTLPPTTPISLPTTPISLPTTPISPPISIVTPVSVSPPIETAPIEYDITLSPDYDGISSLISPITPYDLSPALIPGESSEQSLDFYEDEFSRMIVTILNRNDFTIWCTFITEIFEAYTLPRNATFFVPVNSAVLDLRGKYELASFYVRHHTIPQRLSFADLLKLETSSTLPTLMPTKQLVVTSNSSDSPFNYTINGVLVTQRNIYLSSVFAVHGIRQIFEF